MRVVHVTGSYPPTTFNTGPPQQIHALAQALRAMDVDARVVTTDANGPGTLDVPTGRWVERDGVPVFYGRRIPGSADLSLQTWRALRGERGNADAMHVTGIFGWFNIAVDRVADEVHEVVLKVEVSAKSDQGVHFLIDLSYAGLFGLRNIPEDALPPFLLMEAPRLIFPFARQIISDASQQMGFPALMLDPIDFSQAYSAQIDAMQAQAEGAETNGNGAPQQSVADAPAEDE